MKLESMTKKDMGEQYDSLLLEQWKTCVEMANSTSEKRISTNNVYITINTAIFAVLSFKLDYQSYFLSVVGIIVCILWAYSIKSYKRLNSEKFKIINEIEKKLPVQPFAYEWYILGNEKKYNRFTNIEKALPIVFIGLYSASIVWPLISCLINKK